MSRDKSITIRLTEDQRSAWNEHTEESRKYDSRAELIRQATEERISRDKGEYSVEDQVMQVVQLIESLDTGKLAEIQSTVETIEQVQATSEDLDTAVRELTETIQEESGDQMSLGD